MCASPAGVDLLPDNTRVVPILRAPVQVTHWLSPGDFIVDEYGWMFVLRVTNNPPNDACEFAADIWERRKNGACHITRIKGVDRV